MRPLAPISTAQRRQRRSPLILRHATTTSRAAASTSTATCVGRGAARARSRRGCASSPSTNCAIAVAQLGHRDRGAATARPRGGARRRRGLGHHVEELHHLVVRELAHHHVGGGGDIGGRIELRRERDRRTALHRIGIGEPRGRTALAELREQAERADFAFIGRRSSRDRAQLVDDTRARAGASRDGRARRARHHDAWDRARRALGQAAECRSLRASRRSARCGALVDVPRDDTLRATRTSRPHGEGRRTQSRHPSMTIP